ncbi:MAG: XylR family transcriptional regulator [Planctomycetota bacterium]
MSQKPKVALLIETSRQFGRSFLYGVARYARTHEPWIFYREPGGLLTQSVTRVTDWQPDGMMVRQVKQTEKLQQLDIPIIYVIHYQTDEEFPFPVVVTDGPAIVKMGADHFLDRGFRNFAFCGFNNTPWSIQRAELFEEYIEQAGFKAHIYEQPKSASQQRWEHEQQILADWIKSLPKPVAIMACNDDRGHHVIEACKTHDIRVPEEVAVLGVDNDVLGCDLCEPPLSSIALNTEKAGYEAAELLDRLMQGEHMHNQKITIQPTHITTRRSTDILSIRDADVSKALHFIRNNCYRPITVDDVVDAIDISRRVLEKRFRKILNRSILQEIRRSRTDAAARMLIETEMPIGQIAEKLGYTETAHLSRYFHKEKGISPIAFRKQIRPK